MLRSRLTWLAGLLFLAHILVLITFGTQFPGPLLSNLIELSFGVVALAAAYLAGRRSGQFGQWVWGFVTVALSIWTLAQGIITFYEGILRASYDVMWPSDPLIFFWVVPVFMVLFLATSSGRKSIDAVQALDFAQVAILMLAAYIAYLYVPSQWAGAGRWMAKLGWDATNVRDAVLVGGLVARGLLGSAGLARDLFRRLAAFFLCYQIADLVYHYGEEVRNVKTGSPWDLFWSAPFLVAVIAASSWNRSDESELAGIRAGRDATRQLLFVSSAFLPLPVLVVAIEVNKETPLFGAGLVVASLLLSASRLLITQTRRDQSEKALRHREKEFNEAQRLARIGSWEWEISSDAIHWSEELYRIARRDPSLPPPRFSEFSSIYPEETMQRLRPLVDEAVRNGTPYALEMERILPDGAKKSFVARGEPIRDDSGHVVRLRGTVQDISERKQSEVALQESEERFRGLSDASFEGVAFSDAGKVVLANTRLAEMLGCTMDELIGSDVSVWIAPQSQEIVREHIRKGWEGTYEHYLRRKDGTLFPVETRARQLPWKGKIVRVTAIRDITERKRSEQMLQLLTEGTGAVIGSEFFSSLVRHSSAALNARYAFVSERLEEGRVRMLANWADGALAANVEYDLKGTPCREVLKGQTCIHRENVQSLFPEDEGLARMGVESYLGVPLFDTTGRVIGHLAVLDTKPMPEDRRAMAILEVFAARAGAELERKRALEAVEREKAFSEAVIDSLPGFVFVVNSKGEVIRWNRNAETILGYRREELLQMATLETIVAEDREKVATKWLEAFDKGSALCEARVRTKEGREVPFLLSAVRSGIGNSTYIIGTGIDITERKRAEEALQAEKAFTEAVIDSLPGVFFVHDAEGRLIRWNKNLEEIGYSRKELASMWANDLTAPEDHARAHEARQKVLTEGSAAIELNGLAKDGTRIPHLFSGVRADIGAKVYIVGTGIDITDRKRAEEALRESERRYRELVEHASDIIYETDRNGTFTFVNPVANRILGFSHQELIGRHYLEMIRPNFRSEAENFYRNQRKDRIASTYLQCPVTAKDGSEVWLGQHVQLATEGNRVLGFRAIARDRTKEKLAEDALVESEERFRQMAENSPDMFWIYDLQAAKILYVSPAYENIWNRKIEDLYKNPRGWRDTIHPDDQEYITREFDTRGYTVGSENEHRILWPDGTVRWIHGRTFPIRNAQGEVVRLAGLVYDITERRQVEEALKRQERLFQSIVEDQTEMIVRWKPDGTRTFVNDAYCRMFASSPAKMIGTSFFPLIANEDRERVQKKIATLTPEHPIATDVHRSTLPDDRISWHEWTDRALFDERGHVVELQSVGRDITERKQAEEALAMSEARYRTLIESAPEAIVVLDAETRKFVDFNEHAIRLFGFSGEEILKRTPVEVSPPLQPDGRPSREAAVDHIARAVAGEVPVFEWTHRNAQGMDIPCEVRLVRLPGTGRMLLRGSVTDITNRKQAEAALRASDQRYRDFITHSQEGVWRIEVGDPVPLDLPLEKQIDQLIEHAYMAECNDAMARIVGSSRAEDLVGKRIMAMIPSSDKGRMDSYYSAAQGGWKNRTIQFQASDLEGHQKHLQRTEVPIIENGKLTRIWGTTRDVTDLHRAEEALRASEQRFRQLFERSVAGVVETTLDGRVLECNDAFARIQGYASRADLISANVKEFYLERADGTALIDLLKAQPIVMGQEFQTRRKDGLLVWMLVSASLVEDERGQSTILATAFDITHWKELGEQLRQSQKMEAVGRLAGGVAHDFNNMLQIINGYSELVIDQLPAEDPLRSHVHEIKNIVERAAGLTRQLLAFSRQQVLAPQVLDLNIAVSNLSKMLRRLLGEDVDLELIEGRPLSRVKADPGQIDQVILNLAVNARDAMPLGGKLSIVTANVEVDATYALAHFPMTPGPYVKTSVSDTGHGMNAETQARIFEPFFTTKETGKGTGLGLATVYGIIKQSGGYIWVESEVNKGTTFNVFLPPATEDPASQQSIGGPADVHGTETILLVEDEEYVRSLVRRSLQSKGYLVLEARNGQEALRVSQTHAGAIHLLITDVVMPGMSGRELSEGLAPHRPQIKTLFMSGYTDDSILQRGVMKSGVALLQKPFTADALASKVRQILGDSK